MTLHEFIASRVLEDIAVYGFVFVIVCWVVEGARKVWKVWSR